MHSLMRINDNNNNKVMTELNNCNILSVVILLSYRCVSWLAEQSFYSEPMSIDRTAVIV